MQARAGDRINHYTLLEPLGEGGQGSVWKVVDPRDGGLVRALKLISLAETGPAGFERARREAKILAGARHPALVMCHSLFEEPGEGVVGLVMDLVHGGSLARALGERRLDREQLHAVLMQLADVLAYVHGQGLAHRDLKPENVLLTDGFWEDHSRLGTVKLVDFGIASSADDAMQITAPGAVIGTRPYLAPELIDPATWGKGEGPARDMFAFGVLGCRLLLSRHPTGLDLSATTADYARAYKAVAAGQMAWPPEGLEGRFGAAVAACLALRPADRPANGAALLSMLRDGVTRTIEPHRVSLGSTAPHVTPPGSTAPQTAPMPAPPSGAMQTIAAAPPTAAMPVTPPPSTGRLWAAVLLLAGLVVGLVLHAVLDRSSSDPTAVTASGTTSIPPAPTQAQAFAPCRNAALHFDARATRFACAPCPGTPGPLPAGRWQMRIAGVSGPTPMPRPELPKMICAQVTGGPPVCVPFSQLPEQPGGGRISVTSDDINDGKVYFSIRDRDSGAIAAQGFGRRRPGATKFLESALCSGFALFLYEDPSVAITVFLDDR